MNFVRYYRGLPKYLVLLLLICFSSTVKADLLSVQLEGAKEQIHLDLVQGALYVGNDCSPLLYFRENPKIRTKTVQGKEYTVLNKSTRKAFKSGVAPRLPQSIIVNGDQVEIVSVSNFGTNRAKGKALTGLMTKKTGLRKCSSQ